MGKVLMPSLESWAHFFQRPTALEHRKLGRTEWLNGLRGLACFEVYVFHSSYNWTWAGLTDLFAGWRSSPERDHLWRLPPVRLLYGSGPLMVCIFFIISGFALTTRSLSHIRARNQSALYSSVSSAAVRRLIRIWLPVVGFTIVNMLFTRYLGRGVQKGFGIQITGTLWEQVKDWASQTGFLTNPFSYRDRHTMMHYAKNAWTIPLEIYGSFVCYIILFAMARISRWWMRSTILLCLGAWAGLNGNWFIPLFLFGMALADYDLSKYPTQDTSKWSQLYHLELACSTFWTILLLCGLWIASWPRPSMNPFVRLDLQTAWIQNVAACLILISSYHLSAVREFFETPALQFLGKISFAMYLCHQPVIDELTNPYLVPCFKKLCGEHLYIAFWLVYTITTAVVFFVSFWGEKLLDSPSIRAAKWIEQQITDSDNLEKVDPHLAIAHIA